jgi:hypothetical protein
MQADDELGRYSLASKDLSKDSDCGQPEHEWPVRVDAAGVVYGVPVGAVINAEAVGAGPELGVASAVIAAVAVGGGCRRGTGVCGVSLVYMMLSPLILPGSCGCHRCCRGRCCCHRALGWCEFVK